MKKNKVLYNEGWTCCVDNQVFVSIPYMILGVFIGIIFGLITYHTFFI